MTAADLASPRVDASIEAIEAHRAGSRQHPAPKTILLWHGAMLTEAATCDIHVMAGMCQDELEHHGGVLFA